MICFKYRFYRQKEARSAVIIINFSDKIAIIKFISN